LDGIAQGSFNALVEDSPHYYLMILEAGGPITFCVLLPHWDRPRARFRICPIAAAQFAAYESIGTNEVMTALLPQGTVDAKSVESWRIDGFVKNERRIRIQLIAIAILRITSNNLGPRTRKSWKGSRRG
jgi:hypothetical protein